MWLNIPNKNIREFQDRASAFPRYPELKSIAAAPPPCSKGVREVVTANLIRQLRLQQTASEAVFVADTGQRLDIERLSPAGAFSGTITIAGNGKGLDADPSGIAVDHAGNICVERFQAMCLKLAPDVGSS